MSPDRPHPQPRLLPNGMTPSNKSIRMMIKIVSIDFLFQQLNSLVDYTGYNTVLNWVIMKFWFLVSADLNRC